MSKPVVNTQSSKQIQKVITKNFQYPSLLILSFQVLLLHVQCFIYNFFCQNFYS